MSKLEILQGEEREEKFLKGSVGNQIRLRLWTKLGARAEWRQNNQKKNHNIDLVSMQLVCTHGALHMHECTSSKVSKFTIRNFG